MFTVHLSDKRKLVTPKAQKHNIPQYVPIYSSPPKVYLSVISTVRIKSLSSVLPT